MKVLIGIDDSVYSAAAFEAVKHERWEPGTELVLCSVINEYPIDPYLKDDHLSSLMSDAETWRYNTSLLLRQMEDDLRSLHNDCLVTSIISGGPPAQVLTDIAGYYEYDLIVVGSHGPMRQERMVLGSVADLVVELAPCSVRVVRAPVNANHNIHSPGKVLLCTNGSENSNCAQKAVTELPWTPSAELMVLNVVEEQHDLTSLRFFHTRSLFQTNSHAVDKGKEFVRAKEKELRKKLGGVKIHAVAKEGCIAKVILDQAREFGASLIVVGADSFHRDNQKMGEVAQTIVNYAECSVIVVKEKIAPYNCPARPKLNFSAHIHKPRAYIQNEMASADVT